MFVSKIARVVSATIAIAIAGCAQVLDLLAPKAATRTNSLRVVSATIAPTPEQNPGGTIGRAKVRTPAPATSATLAPTGTPWTPEASATAVPWMPTPTPAPECEKYDGTTPTLRANLEEVRPGVDRWNFQSGCLGWGTQKFTSGNSRRVDLNGWDDNQSMSRRYDVVGGSLMVEIYFSRGHLDMLYLDHYDRHRFRLAGITGRQARFQRVGAVETDKWIEGNGEDPKYPIQLWEGLLRFAQIFSSTPGAVTDVASISTRTNSNGNPSGYDRAILSESASARWGADTVNMSCLPFGGVEKEILTLKTAVGNDVVLFGRGGIGYEWYQPRPWADAGRLEGRGREDRPTGFLLLGTKDGSWGPVMDDLFKYPDIDLPFYWPRPRYVEQQGIFFYNEVEGGGWYYSFTPAALLRERKEVKYTCP